MSAWVNKPPDLDELWDGTLKQCSGKVSAELSSKQRTQLGLEILQVLLEKIRARKWDPGSANTPVEMAEPDHAIILWKLIASELGVDLFFSQRDLVASASDEHDRLFLEIILEKQDDLWGPPTHRRLVDPVPVLIPRWLLTELREALSALNKGEVRPLVQPTNTGRHDRAWTWDEMRTTALAYVAYLQGQGVSKSAARRRVAAAMKNVSDHTLRDWENREGPGVFKDLERRLLLSEAAGRLAVLLADNPDYGARPGEIINLDHLAALRWFQRVPLSAFGESYFENFGERHNSRADGE